MSAHHRYWLVLYAGGTRLRRFNTLAAAWRYLAHHDPAEGKAILFRCD